MNRFVLNIVLKIGRQKQNDLRWKNKNIRIIEEPQSK